MTTAYESLGAAVARERAGNAAWRRLQILAALEYGDGGEAPEWAHLVAELAGFELLPNAWRVSVTETPGAACLRIEAPDGSAFASPTVVRPGVANVIADFGRALIGAKQGATS